MIIDWIDSKELNKIIIRHHPIAEIYPFLGLYKAIIESARKYICYNINSIDDGKFSLTKFVHVKTLINQLQNQFSGIIRNSDFLTQNYFFSVNDFGNVNPYNFIIKHLERIGEVIRLPYGMYSVAPIKFIVFGNPNTSAIFNTCIDIKGYCASRACNDNFGISRCMFLDKLRFGSDIQNNTEYPIVKLDDICSSLNGLNNIEQWFSFFLNQIHFEKNNFSQDVDIYITDKNIKSQSKRWISHMFDRNKLPEYILMRHATINGYSYWIANKTKNTIANIENRFVKLVQFAIDSLDHANIPLLLKRRNELLEVSILSRLPEKEEKLFWLFGYPLPNIRESRHIKKWVLKNTDFEIINPIIRRLGIRI